MALKLWFNDSKLVFNSSGNLVFCENCPCGICTQACTECPDGYACTDYDVQFTGMTGGCCWDNGSNGYLYNPAHIQDTTTDEETLSKCSTDNCTFKRSAGGLGLKRYNTGSSCATNESDSSSGPVQYAIWFDSNTAYALLWSSFGNCPGGPGDNEAMVLFYGSVAITDCDTTITISTNTISCGDNLDFSGFPSCIQDIITFVCPTMEHLYGFAENGSCTITPVADP